MTLHRRDLLKAGLCGLPFLSMRSSLAAMHRVLPTAVPGNPNKKLLTIFLRGANDGLNTVIPHGDQVAYESVRPNIYYGPQGSGAPRESRPIPNYFDVGLHPSLASLDPLLQNGTCALLHRIGNSEAPQRSHFTEQFLNEIGVATYSATNDGWLPQCTPALNSTALMTSVTVSNRMQRQFLSTQNPSVHIQNTYDHAAHGAARNVAIAFAQPGTVGEDIANAVRATLNTTPNYPLVGQATYLRDTTANAIDTLAALRTGLGSFPHDDVMYPSDDPNNVPNGAWTLQQYAQFFDRLEESVQFLSNTVQGSSDPIANCVGIELGGWDFHGNQLARQEALLAVLGHAIRSAHDDLAGQDFLILVVSEFGRTIRDNGSGTDHGVGGVYIAAGPNVVGGVHNCFGPGFSQTAGTPTGSEPWRSLTDAPSDAKYDNAVEPATDFRAILVEVALKHFGVSPGGLLGLGDVGTEWDMIYNNTGSKTEYQLLNFLT